MSIRSGVSFVLCVVLVACQAPEPRFEPFDSDENGFRGIVGAVSIYKDRFCFVFVRAGVREGSRASRPIVCVQTGETFRYPLDVCETSVFYVEGVWRESWEQARLVSMRATGRGERVLACHPTRAFVPSR